VHVKRGLLVLAAAGVAAERLAGPRMATWGATAAEVSGRLPGDGLVPAPTFVSTRAVTIAAPPALVWPWLVQMGQGRAGLYSYDGLENLLGLSIHSADRIIPELQHLERGDHVNLGRGAWLSVWEADPGRHLLLQHPEGDWSWAFVLRPEGPGTRLVVRNRWTTVRAGLGGRVFLRLVQPGSFVMERRMLLGIRDRAEALADAPPAAGGS
jgi:hypothetical protein